MKDNSSVIKKRKKEKKGTRAFHFESRVEVSLLCTSQYASTGQLYNAAEYAQADLYLSHQHHRDT